MRITTSYSKIIRLYPSVSNSPIKSQPGQILEDTGCGAVSPGLVMLTLTQSGQVQGLLGQNMKLKHLTLLDLLLKRK